jgi:nitrate reductase beta subunit
MNIRAQTSMVFHLDKCIGCHTCSVACKNVWTDRAGAEYMWWNNVETKPGTGFPIGWEDQEKYKGGWERKGGGLALRSQSKGSAFFNLFYNPNQPGLDEYYEPWTYKYQDLFDSAAGDDQPTAIPISQITGKPMEIKAGPNWDDDLSGSPIYAENDPNLSALSETERQQLFEVERVAMMYVPRICNHCANPSCVAACPSGALYKRGEDGIVLVNQDKCRGWRACVGACPYKKVYYNWKTGKSEKCILCYPRLETNQPPACFHSCVGRIRYLGVLLYDADKVATSMQVKDEHLVESQRDIFVDPHDPAIIQAAKNNGISDAFLAAAQASPIYKYVKVWKLALPLHVEYRTNPMLFYVPPLLPAMGKNDQGVVSTLSQEFFSTIEASRIPLSFLSKLFSAGNTGVVTDVMKKLLAVRLYRRSLSVDEGSAEAALEILRTAGLTPAVADDIYRMTTMATVYDRFVMPPIQAEETTYAGRDVEACKGCNGFGATQSPERGP